MAFVPVYILILGFTIFVDYFAGIYLEQTQGKAKRYGLYASLFANIGVLAVFKYWNWLNDNITAALQVWGIPQSPLPYLEILLPIGLSFHTFQAISYTIEVYRGNCKAERNFGIYALYVMFYPQLVAGPIERPQNILHQFREPHPWNTRRVISGLQLMAWGLFKKVAVADRLAVIVNQYYDSPYEYYGITPWIATAAFAFQIYCDFSGYSDMAIGAAEVMGFTLMKNFNRPYFSKSVAEFWTRWHISLSTWFRDYVYIPLGGSRVSRLTYFRNLMATFLLSGLWHGASWNFVVWGGVNGSYQISEASVLLNKRSLWHFWHLPRHHWFRKVLGAGTTFFLICITWIFFRAQTMAIAFYVIRTAANLPVVLRSATSLDLWAMGQDVVFWAKTLFALAVLLWVEWYQRGGSLRIRLAKKPHLEALLGAGLVVAIFLVGNLYSPHQFIYFQF
jgi:D-alanyl-lipoteichoic acid acyltransferase DltB (MBOAT superfamily)